MATSLAAFTLLPMPPFPKAPGMELAFFSILLVTFSTKEMRCALLFSLGSSSKSPSIVVKLITR